VIVAMSQIAIGAVDIAKRGGLQDDELGPDRHQQLSPPISKIQKPLRDVPVRFRVIEIFRGRGNTAGVQTPDKGAECARLQHGLQVPKVREARVRSLYSGGKDKGIGKSGAELHVTQLRSSVNPGNF